MSSTSFTPNSFTTAARAIRVRLCGSVQGRGVRPAIFRLAIERNLAGNVCNSLHGVEIVVEGTSADIDGFLLQLPKALPAGTKIDDVCQEEVQVQGLGEFSIVQDDQSGSLSTQIPADIVICGACLDEVFDPNDRRFGYPLNSCAACGPRYTTLRVMPYERPNTSMHSFPFCASCRQEYDRVEDRRFHAETSSCPDCGPRVWLVDDEGQRADDMADVITRSVRALQQGMIVAVRGVGGYQLIVDACNEDAVLRLRRRKGRRGKPLAVMVTDLDEADRLAIVDSAEREALRGPANPIVLCKSRGNSPLADSIHPGFAEVGLMLPTTALHAMLLKQLRRPVVCTSGNREGDPLEVTPEQAEDRLRQIADLWLHHDRPIQRSMDDSVVRIVAGRIATIRLARGFAPLPLDLSLAKPTLAVGGYLKSAIAWADGKQSFLGAHIGDQQSVAARQRFVDQVDDAQSLYAFRADRVIHDDHPDYFSTQWAYSSKLECRSTQHHHAHVVAGMLEQGWLDRTVMGVSWDGTGYGKDGTIWGGEFLVARASSFRRVGHLRPLRLPGGETAIVQPWRIAMAVLQDAVGSRFSCSTVASGIDATLKSSVHQILNHPRLSPLTTSAGRLFDAAAVIVLGWKEAEFDGQGPMMLESIADRQAVGSYPFPFREGKTFQLDWRPLFAELWADRGRGTSESTLAMRFHRSIAAGIVEACRRRAELPVILCGGVFQNRLLVELIMEAMNDNIPLGLPGLIPTNDGGLAAGQLAIAAARENESCV